MTEIKPGDLVAAIDAEGEELPRRAISGVVQGGNFMVIWVCREEEWHAAQREGRHPDGVPWPVGDVQPRHPDEPGKAADEE
jgi:hypothetical protein